MQRFITCHALSKTWHDSFR